MFECKWYFSIQSIHISLLIQVRLLFHLKMQYYGLLTHSFWLHSTLIDGLEWCWLLVDVFISCLDSHSDGTHSLQRIHCWASDGMLNFSKSDEETNSSTSWMDRGWANFKIRIFIYGWTIPLTQQILLDVVVTCTLWLVVGLCVCCALGLFFHAILYLACVDQSAARTVL